MRPTGGHSPVYADRRDWTIFDAGKLVGRTYEDATAGTPAALVLVGHRVRGPEGGGGWAIGDASPDPSDQVRGFSPTVDAGIHPLAMKHGVGSAIRCVTFGASWI